MKKEYNNQSNYYGIMRHNAAIDLNFIYQDKDSYELPENWGKKGIIVDLSASGNTQHQILKTVCQQLIAMYDSLEFGATYLQQQVETGL